VSRRGMAMLAATLALAGCGSVGGSTETEFMPQRDGTFRFRAAADANNRLDSPEGEAARLRMLEDWLQLNRRCPRGYTIVDRRAELRGQGMFADIYDVNYVGRCK
jgi:hypothetical protein